MRYLLRLATMLLLTLWLSMSLAQDGSDKGEISILSADLREAGSGFELIANADISLSPQIRRGLDSGVPLQFIVDFRLKAARDWWPDKTLIAVQHRYSLIYYELTRHYRLQSLSTNESRNFRSLIAALDSLGRISGLEVGGLNVSELQADATAIPRSGHLSIRLDTKALPLPLQPLLSSEWKLASEDFAWSLN